MSDQSHQADPALGREPADPAGAAASPRVTLDLVEAMLAPADEAFALLGPDGKLTWASSNVQRLFGIPAEELVDLSGLGLVHPTDRDRVAAELASLDSPDAVMRSEFRIVLHDSIRWVAVTVQNRSADPEVGSLVGNFRDITQQKEAEVAVRLEATLLASAGQAITALDPEGVINYWNGAAQTVYGWTAEEAIGRQVGDVVKVAEGWEALGAALRQANAAARAWSNEMRVLKKDGTVVPVMATATPLLDEQGALIATTVVSYDTTQELQHQEIAARLAAIVETSHNAIFSTDMAGHITTWNDGATALFGYSESEVAGQHGRLLAGPGVDDLLVERFKMARTGQRADTITTTGRRSDGSALHMSVSLSPIRSADGEVTGVSVIAQDVTEGVEAQHALVHQASHDPLTGLANRRLFVERLEESLERSLASDHHTGVIFIDLDDFKVVNDRFGHVDGDEMLREIGQRIERVVGAGDTVARLGGDEYAVACDALEDQESLFGTVDRIRDAMKPPFRIGTENQTIRASIGMAVSGTNTPAETLIRNADVAMYAAKQAGGNRFELFDDALYAKRRHRRALAAEIDAAVEVGQIHTYFQPEVRLSDETLFGFEALARWTHPQRGPVSPVEFIPIAEQSRAILRIGRQVLRDACRAAATWTSLVPERPVLVSVNLSPVQLADPGLHETVHDAISAAGIAPAQVCLEVTESALMEFDVATKAMARLKDVGVSIAIDDFGTGYSSLSRLKAFPVDFLKIDRSFVDGLGRYPDDEAIVAAVIGLARSLGVQVIAEGIETPTQFDRLRELGCQYGQGYLWSRPVPEPEAARWASVSGELPRNGA